MSEKSSRKLRQIMKRTSKAWFREIKTYPFTVRWRIAWFIMFGDKKIVQ